MTDQFRICLAGVMLAGCLATPAEPAPSAARIAFTAPPAVAYAGLTIEPPVQVTAYDATGNVAVGFTDTITITLGANPGGATLGGTTSVAASAGVASFADLTIDKVGIGYTLTASTSRLPTVVSPAFNMLLVEAPTLVFTVQPVNGTAGQALPAVDVTARDAFGNTVTGFTGNVTLALANNPTGATLSGTTTVAAVAGVATFTTLTVDRAGVGYALSASAPGLVGGTSAPFDVSP